MSIVDRDILAYLGGAALARYGRITRTIRTPKLLGEEGLETWTRSSTGLYRRRDGLYNSAGNDIPRVERLDLDGDGILETPSLIVEGSRTNLIQNGDYESDTAGTGGNAGPTLARDNTNVINGSWSLHVTTANANNCGPFWKNRDGTSIAATAGTTYTFSLWVYAPAGTVGKSINLRIEWYNSTPTVISATSTAFVMVAGWQRIQVTAAAPATTVTAIPTFYTNGAIGVFDFWCELAQLEANPFATNPIATNTGTVTQASDAASIPFYAAPQAMFLYSKFVERGANADPGASQWHTALTIGNFGSPNWRIELYSGNNNPQYFITSGNNVSQVIENTPDAPSVGDVVEVLAFVQATGAVQITMSRNGGAPTASAVSGPQPLPATFGVQKLFLGSDNSSTIFFNPIIAAIVGRGTPSFADCRSLMPTFGPTF